MEKSKKKTKILISAILLGIFLIGAVVSIVLVLAASTQNVTSNITVSYVADGVGVKVNASYATVPTSDSASITRTAMTNDSGAEEVTFSVAESKTSKALAPAGDITLSTSALKVVFEYVFENTAETAFSIELLASPTGINMTETYCVSGTRLSESDYRTDITDTSLSPQAVTSLGQKVYIYIMASVTNENLSASYNGGFNWKLNQQSTIDVTLNTGGTTSTLKVIPTSAVTGIAMPVLNSIPANGSKVFLGYYTAEDGSGTQYIAADGTSAHAADLTAGTTLYVNFSEDTVVMSGTSVTGLSEEARILGEVIIPETTTEIGANAFENETSLTQVTFAGAEETEAYADGSVLTTIGASAFKGCSGLTELIIPEGVTSIGEGALQNLTNVTHLVIPSTVTSLPGGVLDGCSAVKHLEINLDAIPEGNILSMAVDGGLDQLWGLVATDMGGWYEGNGKSAPSMDTLVLNGGSTTKYAQFCVLKVKYIKFSESIRTIEQAPFMGIISDYLKGIEFENPTGWLLNNTETIDLSDPVANISLVINAERLDRVY